MLNKGTLCIRPLHNKLVIFSHSHSGLRLELWDDINIILLLHVTIKVLRWDLLAYILFPYVIPDYMIDLKYISPIHKRSRLFPHSLGEIRWEYSHKFNTPYIRVIDYH